MSEVERNRPTVAQRARRTVDVARFARWLAGPAGTGLIGVFFTVGTAAFSAAGGIAPDLAAEGWSQGRDRVWWLVVFLCLGVAAVAGGAALWWWRNRLRETRGIAYVVNETAAEWTPEQKEGFLSEVRDQFAVFRPVPPLRSFDRTAVWPHGEEATRWGRDMDAVVRHFQVANHDPDGRDAALDRSLFMWAPWPVAVAFGQRTTTLSRGRAVRVRQRDSFGRQGPVRARPVQDDGHSFQQQIERPGDGLFGELNVRRHQVRLQISRNGQPGTAAGPVPVPATAPGTALEPVPEVLLLVLRTNHNRFGLLPSLPVDVTDRAAHDDAAAGSREPVVFELHDAVGLGLPATMSTELREWRYLPPPGETQHRWADYPAIVAAAAQWVADQAAAAPEAIVLLGAQLPQEISVGLGIWSARQYRWPRHVWPIYFQLGAQFTIPQLDLGRPT